MDRSWYWKAGFIVAVALASVYALIPSVSYFKLPADQRNEAGVFDSVRPKWAPPRHLNLGLDLQGGIHLVLGVEVERAVREKAVRRGDELGQELERKEIKGAVVTSDVETGIVTVTAKDPAILDKARTQITDDYKDMYVRGQSGDAFTLSFKDADVKALKDSAVDQAVKAIRNRVDKWGVSEPSIARRGDSNILVQLPGYSNPEKAKELLGRTAQLEFKIVDDDDAAVVALKDKLPPGVELDFDRHEGEGGAVVRVAYLHSKDRTALGELHRRDAAAAGPRVGHQPPRRSASRTRRPTAPSCSTRRKVLSGEYINDASMRSSISGRARAIVPRSRSTSTAQGAELFAKLTTDNVKRLMAIVLDDNVESAPIINEPITGGICSIHMGGLKPSGNEIQEEAKDLALVLKSGALPAPVRILEERSVGASLGPELIRRGAYSALLGLFAVLVFMALYYRFSGFVADIALVLNGLVVLGVMATLDSTLTLPGIAGFVLTLGMAVDANVLINERIREEMKTGRSLASALQTGYDKVFWTIFDGHVTALVAGFVIRAYGSGPVRGFATTLIIGLLASMFTSIVVTRAILEWFVGHGRLHKAVSF